GPDRDRGSGLPARPGGGAAVRAGLRRRPARGRRAGRAAVVGRVRQLARRRPARGVLMETVRLTTAAALVRYLIAQRVELDGAEAPLFPGVFAICAHASVTSRGLALQEARDELPTWRGQNEQGMALAAVA